MTFPKLEKPELQHSENIPFPLWWGIYEKNVLPDPFFCSKWGTGKESEGYHGQIGHSMAFFLYIPRHFAQEAVNAQDMV